MLKTVMKKENDKLMQKFDMVSLDISKVIK